MMLKIVSVNWVIIGLDKGKRKSQSAQWRIIKVSVNWDINVWHPDATLIKQNARGTAGDNCVNCNRIPRPAVWHSARTAWRFRGTENRANRNGALEKGFSPKWRQATI